MNLRLLASGIIVATFIIGCSKDSETSTIEEKNNLINELNKSGHTYYVELAQKANVDEILTNHKYPYTVIAPSNDAIIKKLKAMGYQSIQEVSTKDAEYLVLSKILLDKKESNDLKTAFHRSLARTRLDENVTLFMKNEDRGIMVDGNKPLDLPPTEAGNSLIYNINDMPDPDDVLSIIMNHPKLKQVAKGLERLNKESDKYDLNAMLKGKALSTIFVTPDDQIDILLRALKYNSIEEVPLEKLEFAAGAMIVMGRNFNMENPPLGTRVKTLGGYEGTIIEDEDGNIKIKYDLDEEYDYNNKDGFAELIISDTETLKFKTNVSDDVHAGKVAAVKVAATAASVLIDLCGGEAEKSKEETT